jgi:cytoskeletal protein CcmA (bactofilin family)
MLKIFKSQKGIALILVYSLLVILIGILGVFFYTSIQSMQTAQRRVDFTRAFYAAESGIDKKLQDLLDMSTLEGELVDTEGNITAIYKVDAPEKLTGNKWRIASIGYSPADISGPRSKVKIEVIAEKNFSYAIETEGDLEIRGQASRNIDPDETNPYSENIDFEALFGITKDEMKAMAKYVYDEDTFGEPVDTITWVDVSNGQELTIAGRLEGSGILVVSGDVHIAGTGRPPHDVKFEGIIYIIGSLTITGNATIDGTVLVESGADTDTTISGNVTIIYDPEAIESALEYLGLDSNLVKPKIISWYEVDRAIES